MLRPKYLPGRPRQQRPLGRSGPSVFGGPTRSFQPTPGTPVVSLSKEGFPLEKASMNWYLAAALYPDPLSLYLPNPQFLYPEFCIVPCH